MSEVKDKFSILEEKNQLAEVGGGVDRIEKLHAAGRKTARERIQLLLDQGTFVELDKFVVHKSHDFGMEKSQYAGDGVVSGYGKIDGVDFVTEGIITLKKVLEIIQDYMENPMILLELCNQKDAASLLSIFLIEQATDINIYFGMASNSAHEGTDIDFQTKLSLIDTKL
jgi:hypothetical protein